MNQRNEDTPSKIWHWSTLPHWLKKEYHTFPACALISAIFVSLCLLIGWLAQIFHTDSIVSCALGIPSFFIAGWTLMTAYKIKDHVRGKVKLNAVRKLREKWNSTPITEEYVPKEDLKNARRVINNILSDNRIFDVDLVKDIKHFRDSIQGDNVELTIYLGALDDLISLINNI